MKLKEIEDKLMEHLMEAPIVREHLKSLDTKMNWVMGMISAIFIAMLVELMRR